MEQVKHKRSGATAAILKVMGVFSGVQVVTILCSVVRTKLVALWVGAAGVGLSGIFYSALEMLGALTTLGIGASSIRDIASADGREKRLTAAVTLRWGVVLGLLGAVVMLAAAPLLSDYSFGDSAHTSDFLMLAVCMALNAMAATNLAVLQGFKCYRNLARASIGGAAGGLIVSAPLYYFLGIAGIVPALIGFSVVNFVAARVNRARIDGAAPSRREMWLKGRSMLRLGAYMTATGFISYLVNYIFLSWLNLRADVETVGYYQAGFTLFNRYAGLIFTAITVEYYPRLASVSLKPRSMSVFVNHEATLLMLMLLVIVPVFILCAPMLIMILYSAEFMVMLPLVVTGITGTVFRALSWSMSYTILARGDGRRFLLTEIVSAATCLALNIGGWLTGGLAGLGVSYILWYAIYSAIVGAVYRGIYGMRMRRSVLWLTAGVFGICALSAGVALLTPWWWLNIPVAGGCVVLGLKRLLKLYRR